ncbi:MAG TPA: hypothetical protein VJ741_17090, partial [Solirubrobacteraceae bacterium]|nr:hypothetical protein [Solirubrobacteraceae bacterium]
ERDTRPVHYVDGATGETLNVSPAAAASASGLLPAFLVGGEAIWREATGKGFGLDIVRDSQALLGYRLRGIGAGSFATVMLSTMEAAHQVARPEAIVASDLQALWSSTVARIARDAVPVPRASTGPAP